MERGRSAVNLYRRLVCQHWRLLAGQRVGAYLQDLIEINPYWKALAGVRFDTLDFTFNRSVTISYQRVFNLPVESANA